MKFGKTLLNNQIPEWSRNYISYKALKKEIKAASSQLPPPEESITAVFFKLDRELEKVNTFFVYKQNLIDRRLWILDEKYDKHRKDESDELSRALKETRSQMNKLLWFAEMNSKGFRKMLKKLDKKLGLETQAIYWETKVAVLPFATPVHLKDSIEKLNDWINNLSCLEQPSANTSSTLKLARFKSNNEDISLTIQNDNVSDLKKLLKEGTKIDETLLDLAVEHQSIQCLEFLKTKLGLDLLNHKDLNERNLLHRVCIRSSSSLGTVESLLSLEPELSMQKDFAGRRPLHYAAESNHAQLVNMLLNHAIKHGHYTINAGFADQTWQDREGFTPLFYGILHGSTEAVKEMLEVGHITDIDELIASGQKSPPIETDEQNEFLPDFARSLHHPSSVALACKLGNLDLLKLLISKGASSDLADEDGETPLLFAIRSHFVEGVKVLIDQGCVNVNLPEKINGWTPLMVAAIEGHRDITEILLTANADKEIIDNNEWTASDHAVFRGFLDIGKLTKPANPTRYVKPTVNARLSGENSPPRRTSKAVARASRVYGHKYLTDQCMIIITLGSNDVRNPLCSKFIELSKSFLGEDQHRRLSLSVSATNASGEFPIIDLPMGDFHSHWPEPIVLFAARPEEVILRFDLIDTFSSSRNNSILARGTSVLAADFIFNNSKGFQNQTERGSLRGRLTVPLVQAKDLEYVGTLGFEYFVITPFKHKNMRIGDRYTYYKSVDTQVIGHRGSGMNRKGSRLQVGENTVLAFVTAASLGAEYVEFDVQLTKDLVPVVYHDFTVTETGYDIPLNSITLEQFLNLRRSGQIKEYHTGIKEGAHGTVISTQRMNGSVDAFADFSSSIPHTGRINRSFSFTGTSSNTSSPKRHSPIDQTRFSKSGKVKGNGPETIQAPFTTLAETLRSVPKSAGFNIEVKYPMVDEAEQDELNQFQEINVYVDTILECVYDNVEEDRHIIFSSFHPEICLALNLKQPNYPVFFLTDAGTLPMADVRCNSLQEAVRFAKQADLLGIVAASQPILEAPKMVQVIKETGLLLFTYGVLNNEVENAIAQKCYGVDAVIVDSVLAIRKGLRGTD
ncbi:hypothetical protein RMCBS344292_12291 [Rhizopus microsporus]|nr:hypothetical protein RMCBS344292_12291 [Rhizopus microsporus]